MNEISADLMILSVGQLKKNKDCWQENSLSNESDRNLTNSYIFVRRLRLGMQELCLGYCSFV